MVILILFNEYNHFFYVTDMAEAGVEDDGDGANKRKTHIWPDLQVF
jgi:hypothetical protein